MREWRWRLVRQCLPRLPKSAGRQVARATGAPSSKVGAPVKRALHVLELFNRHGTVFDELDSEVVTVEHADAQ